MGYLLVIGAVVVAVLTGLWQSAEAGLDREKKARVTAELAAKGYAAGLTQCRTEIAEKNALVLRFMALPEARLRLCATRPPNDPCCKPAPAEPGKDECKP